MRRILFACAVLAALPLSGCTTMQSWLSGESIAQQAPATIADAEKALAVAHLAYQAAGVTLEQAASKGLLHGADAASAQALYDRAGAALDLADQADEAANAQGVTAQVQAAEALIAEIDSTIPKQE